MSAGRAWEPGPEAEGYGEYLASLPLHTFLFNPSEYIKENPFVSRLSLTLLIHLPNSPVNEERSGFPFLAGIS